jgi:pantoate--beta-alanine ligase
MRIIRSIEIMQRVGRDLRQANQSVGFVPTMGALHAGHLSLIKQAVKENSIVVVSIFVNPAQFGPREDLRRYPRNFKADAAACRRLGVGILFYPEASRIYLKDYKTYIVVERLSDVLCGKFRPGHFKGVATIVAKLFNIVQPDTAYFGQKDAQQAVIIRQMTRDLNLPVKIRVMPIIRQSDGLALSSRNSYLTSRQNKDALVLYQALEKARAMVGQGTKDATRVMRAMRKIIGKKKSARIQYIQAVDLDELRPLKKIKGRVLIALAVYIGKTRLIDNIIV